MHTFHTLLFCFCSICLDSVMSAVKIKVKVKVALWGFSTLRLFGLLYSYPQQVPTFISRGATHHTDARDLYQRRWELLPMNFASKSIIHENSLGCFTCRKAVTWDIFIYFPSEGRHAEDFPDARKIQRLRPSLNPRTRVPVASMLNVCSKVVGLFFWVCYVGVL